MLSWIPLLGPIIQGISSIFTGYFSEKSTIAVSETEASVKIIQATQDDIGLRIMRDLLCLPVVIWAAIIGWDTIIVAEYPDWMFVVAPYPKTVEWMPYAVCVFLLGNIGINMWTRK